jgi:hypothetical protein
MVTLTLPLNTAWMSVDNTTRPAMEFYLDIAVMFFVISSALLYYLDHLASPSTPWPRPRPPGRALDPLNSPSIPWPRHRPPGHALDPLATPWAPPGRTFGPLSTTSPWAPLVAPLGPC